MRTLVFAVLLDLLLWGLIAGTGTSGAGLPTGVEFGFLAVGPPGLGADELVEQDWCQRHWHQRSLFINNLKYGYFYNENWKHEI